MVIVEDRVERLLEKRAAGFMRVTELVGGLGVEFGTF